MKRGILLTMLPFVALAKFQTVDVTPEVIEKYEQIVDIRTEEEWIQTGIIPNAKTVTFNYDEKFLDDLSKQVDLKKPVALICRTGNRSAVAAQMIDFKDANIINLDGGMMRLIRQGYKTTPYKK
ncbi:MAG: rhodanese-like domain-containing protein [Campylobacter sp.]